MPASPRMGFTEIEPGETIPEQVVAEDFRFVEQGAGCFIVKDKDLAIPPALTDGNAYIIAGSPTLAWAGRPNQIAFVLNSSWAFIIPIEGTRAYAQDEDKWLQYSGAVWVADTNLSTLACGITSQAGTSYTAVLADANTRVRFTSASPVAFTVPPNSSVAYPVGTFIEYEQAGAGAVTATAGAGVTIRNRAGFDVTAGQYAVAGLRKVATDEWSLTGDLA